MIFFTIIFLLAVFNLTVFFVFKKFLYKKPDEGMKFLVINISKDLIWLVISLIMLEKTKTNFLFIVISFIIGSLLIYIPIIKLINKS
ncbi:hypothetical protein IW15_12055 [Chryseobacterium soli]|uniref:Uncharacterized protein n=1 Tax=Chryseobacterium soli TaxID=445961 RepID=A0A086A6H2_9FLAO|nr:hypothetical protein IW15_12055 [Chryseobacterium soli]